MELKEVFDNKELRDELLDNLLSLNYLEYKILDYDRDDEPYFNYYSYPIDKHIDDFLFNNDIIKCDRCNGYHYEKNCKLSVDDGYICESCMNDL